MTLFFKTKFGYQGFQIDVPDRDSFANLKPSPFASLY